MASWAVVGASGFVGRNVVALIEAEGHRVSKVKAPRMVSGTRWLPEQVVESVRGNVAVLSSLAEELTGHDVVINAAGLATPGAAASPSLFGANAALPVAVFIAARMAGVPRVIHISSAAVQGRKPELDESMDLEPFSPYSHSKALAERSLSLLSTGENHQTGLYIIRATSIQDKDRDTTRSLIRFAGSPFASVAAPGTAPSPVSSVSGLMKSVLSAGTDPERGFAITVQPWEGLTVRDVILTYGKKEPLQLPAPLCKAAIRLGYFLASMGASGIEGSVRRAEVLWLGQRIKAHEVQEHND